MDCIRSLIPTEHCNKQSSVILDLYPGNDPRSFSTFVVCISIVYDRVLMYWYPKSEQNAVLVDPNDGKVKYPFSNV